MGETHNLMEQVDSLIEKGYKALDPANITGSGNRQFLDPRIVVGWRSQSLTLLRRLFGGTSDYFSEFQNTTQRAHIQADMGPSLGAGLGILQSVKEDIQNGHLQSYRQLVEADLIGGLMGQAEYLLEKGYLVAAAAVAGAALQQELEEIAKRHDLKLKNREDLNSLSDKLFQAEILDGIERRQLSLMAGVRNSADHGKAEELTKDNVSGLVRDAVNFLNKHAT